MFLLYNFLLTLLAPIWVPWMLLRARSREEKPSWKERQGEFDIAPKKGARRVWIHAVSVGEVVASLPILTHLRTFLPNHEVVLSVTTSSGHRTAREKAAGLYDHLVYFPIDVARFQLAAMTRVRPEVVAIMETELWFNFLWAAKAMGATTLLVNGRISDRSFPRAWRIRFFYRSMLRYLDRALMQTGLDADRIRALGATHVEVLGNCKFDEGAFEEVDAAALRSELGIGIDEPVIVVGSTRSEEEEALVIEAISLLDRPSVRIVHAPRHLERADALAAAVAELAAARRVATLTLAAAALAMASAKLFIVGATLSPANLIGLGLALVCLPWRHRPTTLPALTIAMFISLLASGLAPFDPLSQPKTFLWMPFSGMLQGSMSVNLLNLLEKCFFYGALIVLISAKGGRPWAAAIVVAGCLAMIEAAQAWLPNRTAESTDPVLALILGFVIRLGSPSARQLRQPPAIQAARGTP